MKLSPLTLTLALVLAAPPLGAQGADEIERGRQLYMTNGCYSCHGTVGQGGERSAGPRLAPDPYPFDAFKALVRQPRETMPRLDPRHVSDEQLLAIRRYLASIPKGRAAKDIPQLQFDAR